MLDKRDMLDLIQAQESINLLNDQISILTGGCDIKNEKINGIYKIYDVIKRNSKYNRENDNDYLVYDSIIHSAEKSTEEKYNMLMP